MTTPDEQRWKDFEEALTYMYEHPATPLENDPRGPEFFEGYRTAISWVHYQFELASRRAGFPESDHAIGPIVSRMTGLPKEGQH